MKYKAVIFDLDGVICSTDEYHYLAWKELADKINIPFDRNTNELLRGVSRRESLEIILRAAPNLSLSEDEKIDLMEEKNNTYRELLKKLTPKDLSLDVKSTLDELRERGLLLGIGSSSKNTKFILNQINLGDFFDAIADGTDIENSKPDPEVFLLASERLGVNPLDCLVIEDAKAGIEAASRAGMDSAAIGDAKNNPKHTYDVNKFEDILTFVETKEEK